MEAMQNTIDCLTVHNSVLAHEIKEKDIMIECYEEHLDSNAGEDGIDWKSMYFKQLERANHLKRELILNIDDKRKYQRYHKDKDNECEELREHSEKLSDKYIKELEENKELKLKIKALETSVKIYTENDAENIAEFCEMVNQDCNKLQEQIEIQKRMIKDLKECPCDRLDSEMTVFSREQTTKLMTQ